jgi:hypothetical protein
MGWEIRDRTPRHICPAPMRTPGHVPNPAPSGPSLTFATQLPDGRIGDLWRCDHCRRLWRIGEACDLCDYRRRVIEHAGAHAVGLAWRAARPFDHVRAWRRGMSRRTPPENGPTPG